MNVLGMALGVLIWSTTSCLGGWATSRFGLFGIPQTLPESLLLNYLEVVLVIAGGAVYMFIHNESSETLSPSGEVGASFPKNLLERVEPEDGAEKECTDICSSCCVSCSATGSCPAISPGSWPSAAVFRADSCIWCLCSGSM